MIPFILGIHKFCHMSNILKCLKIFNFEELNIFSKLHCLNSIQKNEITNHHIYRYILALTSFKKNQFSNSFYQNIKLLEKISSILI